MRRFLLIPICFVALLIPVAVLAGGAEGGFDGVVNTLENRYHVRATRIPFLGLISFVSRRATHGGVGNMHVAEFEHFSAEMDGEELNQLVQTQLGPGWERVIRETSRKPAAPDSDGSGRKAQSQTLVFMRPEGQHMGLFVLDADGHELDVVQLSVDPGHLAESVNHYQHHHDAGGADDDAEE